MLYTYCTRFTSQTTIQDAINKDIEAKSASQIPEPANIVLRDAWCLHLDNSQVIEKQKKFSFPNNKRYEVYSELKLSNLLNFFCLINKNNHFQGSLTSVNRKAAIVYTQVWLNNREKRQQFFSRFRWETVNARRVEDYPFTGFFAALASLPRYRFQFRDNVNNAYQLESIDLSSIPIQCHLLEWSRVILARGSKTNYLSHLSVGDVFTFDTFTSFSSNFQTALQFSIIKRRMSKQKHLAQTSTIFLIEEDECDWRIEDSPAYARPMLGLSIFPYQNEFLIDPITRFKIRSVKIVDFDYHKRVTIVLLRYVYDSNIPKSSKTYNKL